MTIRVLSHRGMTCEEDGHVIALRLRWDLDVVRVTPFCERCHLLFLPSSSMSGRWAEWLMSLVDSARLAPEASSEDYESMFLETI